MPGSLQNRLSKRASVPLTKIQSDILRLLA